MAGKKAAKKNAAAAQEKIDPTLPYVDIELEGKKFKMCLVFRALAKAQQLFRERDGRRVDLLAEMNAVNAENVAILFAASLVQFHPELTFADVEAMVDYDSYSLIVPMIRAAFLAALPKRMLQQVIEAEAELQRKDGAASNGGSGSSPGPASVSA